MKKNHDSLLIREYDFTSNFPLFFKIERVLLLTNATFRFFCKNNIGHFIIILIVSMQTEIRGKAVSNQKITKRRKSR